MNMNYMFMSGYAKHLSLLLVGCFINVRWTGWTGPFCCAAILPRFAEELLRFDFLDLHLIDFSRFFQKVLGNS